MKGITLKDITNNRNQTIEKGEEVEVTNTKNYHPKCLKFRDTCDIKNKKGYKIIVRISDIEIVEED